MAKNKKKKNAAAEDGFVIEGDTPKLGVDDCAVIIRSSGKMEIMISPEPSTNSKATLLTRYYAQLCAWAVGDERIQEQFLAFAQTKLAAFKTQNDKHTTDDNSAGNDDDDGTSLN